MVTQPLTLENPEDHRVFYSRDVTLKWRNCLSKFEVVEPFTVLWIDERGKTLSLFTIDAGFMTDLASIPRIVQSFIPKIAHHLQPSVVHDWLYQYDQNLTRAQADLMFLEGMRDEGVGRVRRNVMYRGVRIGGARAWGPDKVRYGLFDPWDFF